jgi:hypothetical protein
MKTMLVLLAALAISAQGIDPTIHRSPFSKPYMPDEYFTMHRLNGVWWKNATPVERKIYLLAWQDATGLVSLSINDNIYELDGFDLNVPVKDMLKITTNPKEWMRYHQGPATF